MGPMAALSRRLMAALPGSRISETRKSPRNAVRPVSELGGCLVVEAPQAGTILVDDGSCESVHHLSIPTVRWRNRSSRSKIRANNLAEPEFVDGLSLADHRALKLQWRYDCTMIGVQRLRKPWKTAWKSDPALGVISIQ